MSVVVTGLLMPWVFAGAGISVAWSASKVRNRGQIHTQLTAEQLIELLAAMGIQARQVDRIDQRSNPYGFDIVLTKFRDNIPPGVGLKQTNDGWLFQGYADATACNALKTYINTRLRDFAREVQERSRAKPKVQTIPNYQGGRQNFAVVPVRTPPQARVVVTDRQDTNQTRLVAQAAAQATGLKLVQLSPAEAANRPHQLVTDTNFALRNRAGELVYIAPPTKKGEQIQLVTTEDRQETIVKVAKKAQKRGAAAQALQVLQDSDTPELKLAVMPLFAGITPERVFEVMSHSDAVQATGLRAISPSEMRSDEIPYEGCLPGMGLISHDGIIVGIKSLEDGRTALVTPEIAEKATLACRAVLNTIRQLELVEQHPDSKGAVADLSVTRFKGEGEDLSVRWRAIKPDPGQTVTPTGRLGAVKPLTQALRRVIAANIPQQQKVGG